MAIREIGKKIVEISIVRICLHLWNKPVFFCRSKTRREGKVLNMIEKSFQLHHSEFFFLTIWLRVFERFRSNRSPMIDKHTRNI